MGVVRDRWGACNHVRHTFASFESPVEVEARRTLGGARLLRRLRKSYSEYHSEQRRVNISIVNGQFDP